ncbi:hypothetical protein [Nonomuraea sp. NPDC003214]
MKAFGLVWISTSARQPERPSWPTVTLRLARCVVEDGLHITVFQELSTLEERASHDGFGTDAGRSGD